MRLAGHGSYGYRDSGWNNDRGAVVATIITRAFIFGEPTTDMIAPAKQLISYQRPIFT